MIRIIPAAAPALALGLITLSLTQTALAIDTGRADVRAFVNELAREHGFERDYVETLLARGQSQEKILDAMRRPAEKTKAWHEYREIFITEERIEAGRAFMSQEAPRLTRISLQTGVPAEVIAAIVGVETYYGRITGSYRVLDALATLAFDYPPRAGFFRGELEQFFLLARDEALPADAVLGSYAGAMGPPQFIPSSYRAYAVDGDGDGRRDLLGNWDDILASVANYFVEHGWQANQPIAVRGVPEPGRGLPSTTNKLKLNRSIASLAGDGLRVDLDLPGDTPAALFELDGADELEYWIGFRNFYVITRYNRSAMYALAVFQLSEALRGEGAAVASR
jgi:membrane-bound lytic murein transglycosylase B